MSHKTGDMGDMNRTHAVWFLYCVLIVYLMISNQTTKDQGLQYWWCLRQLEIKTSQFN